ncbi:unnamed protein product [Linum trigynum]|uniref:Uncharacterized protein n=1 Tax=Linum trigynum TaxID=586398 RepID=A0AAV2CQ09_9ROSI
MWQSFDYAMDTLLLGMKLGAELKFSELFANNWSRSSITERVVVFKRSALRSESSKTWRHQFRDLGFSLFTNTL